MRWNYHVCINAVYDVDFNENNVWITDQPLIEERFPSKVDFIIDDSKVLVDKLIFRNDCLLHFKG